MFIFNTDEWKSEEKTQRCCSTTIFENSPIHSLIKALILSGELQEQWTAFFQNIFTHWWKRTIFIPSPPHLETGSWNWNTELTVACTTRQRLAQDTELYCQGEIITISIFNGFGFTHFFVREWHPAKCWIAKSWSTKDSKLRIWHKQTWHQLLASNITLGWTPSSDPAHCYSSMPRTVHIRAALFGLAESFIKSFAYLPVEMCVCLQSGVTFTHLRQRASDRKNHK